jgi:hypothetical protein
LLWREAVKQVGFPDLYIGFAQTNEYFSGINDDGFDFSFDFQPNFTRRPSTFKDSISKRYFYEFLRKLKINHKNKYQSVYDYEEYVKLQMAAPFDPKSYPSITPMWDNSARRKVNYFILHNSTPHKYKMWLQHIINNYNWGKMPEPFLFINAWNEWAEGNHLEPCQKWGKGFLEATKEALLSYNQTLK